MDRQSAGDNQDGQAISACMNVRDWMGGTAHTTPVCVVMGAVHDRPPMRLNPRYLCQLPDASGNRHADDAPEDDTHRGFDEW